MGKAKKKLNKARNAYFKTLKDKEDKNTKDLGQIDDYKNEDEYKLKTCFDLKQMFVSYAIENSLPLCEFIDVDNIETFINTLIL